MRWFTLILIGCVSVQAAGAVINVPADQATIQAAIVAAVNGDEIIVAPGTYPESINFLGKAITVRSTDPTDPVVVMQTIIDGTGFFHVVICDSGEGPNTVLSGFVITGGNANGAGFPNEQGGGMYINNTSPIVSHCSFIKNSATNHGGGMYIAGVSASPKVTDCTFSSNTARFGAGMYNISSSPTVTNCCFSGNVSPNGSGGGMLNTNSSATVSDCTFSGNSAAGEGGGMANVGIGTLVVSDCSFSGNSALVGGGMYNRDVNTLVQRCEFSVNTARESGGGMYNDSNSTIENCKFSANSCDLNGGGMFNFDGNPSIDGCTFIANSAALGPIPAPGGGLHIDGGAPVLTNTGFCGNIAATLVGTWTDNGGNSLLYCAPPSPPPPDTCLPDINDDGSVNVTDLLALLAAWGACP